MDLREILLIGHILGALVVAAGLGAGILARLTAGSLPDLPTVVRTTRIQSLGGRIAAFGMLVVLALGVWLIIEVDWIEFSDAWISAAFALWIILMGIGGGMIDRHARKLRNLAASAMEAGNTSSAEVQAAWEAPLPKIGQALFAIGLVVFLYLMVVKPGM